MSDEDKLDQQIEGYIHQRMNEAERIAFENQMQANPLLQQEVEELLTLKNDFDKDLFEFKKKLLGAKEELKKEDFFNTTTIIDLTNRLVTKKKLLRWVIAASFILLVGVFYIFNNRTNYKQLAMNAALNDFPQARGTEDELDSLFNIGAYEVFINKAVTLLKDSLSQEKKSELTTNILRCYILLNKPEQANSFFASVTDEIKANCEVKYASALALINLKEKEKAIKLLNAVINNKCYPLDKEAQNLKKQLE